MRAYLIRRLLLVVPTFIGITLITFVVVQLAPGSPVYLMLHGVDGALEGDAATQQIIEQMQAQFGLDQPIHIQYAHWLRDLLTLDFGASFRDGRPVIDKIMERLPVTLELSAIAIFLTYIISVPIGVYSATHRQSWGDTITTLILFILYSLPSFWVAMLLIFFFAGGQFLNWFPVHGLHSFGAENYPWHWWLLDHLWHLVLPVFCLTYTGLAALSRYARAGMIEQVRQDYIRTARAYGFSEKVVIFKYAMRNSLIPIITLMATLLPMLISGSVIIERIFSIPGLGMLAFESVLTRDYPVIMGILSISALLTLAGLILSDILYAIADPRIRFD